MKDQVPTFQIQSLEELSKLSTFELIARGLINVESPLKSNYATVLARKYGAAIIYIDNEAIPTIK